MSLLLIPAIVNSLQSNNFSDVSKLKEIRINNIVNSFKTTGSSVYQELEAQLKKGNNSFISKFYDIVLFLAKTEGLYTKTNNSKIGIGFDLKMPGAKMIFEKLNLDYNKVLNGEAELSLQQVGFLLNESLLKAHKTLEDYLSRDVLYSLPNPVRAGMISMALNLNKNSLKSFTKLKTALTHKDYNVAINEIKNSRWATQPNNKVELISSLFSLAS